MTNSMVSRLMDIYLSMCVEFIVVDIKSSHRALCVTVRR